MRSRRFAITHDNRAATRSRSKEQLGEVVRQTDAAVTGGIAGTLARMHRDTAPRKPLHVRHGRVIVFLGAVGFFFLKNGEDTPGCIVALGTGAYRRSTDENAVTINVHRLLWDTHQDHNWTLRRELRIPPIVAGFE